MSEVVVTATRTERQLSALPMPVLLIPKTQIRQMGSMRLTEVLAEQTGLSILTDHGQGVQIQGLAPEYTLILVDGEPLIGRTAGTLELSRLAVGNIRQVEIVKGPSSSLYGSEALAGVINLITEKPNGTKGSFKSRYGTNQTADISGDFSYRYKKLGLYGFVNRYQTGGYDLSPQTFGATVEPFTNYTFQTKTSYDFSDQTKLSVSGRLFTERQASGFNLATTDAPDIMTGKGRVTDWNLNPGLQVKWNALLQTQFRFYASRYHTSSQLIYEKDGATYEDSFFRQTFLRPEFVATYVPHPKHTFTLGGGYIGESVAATRYENKKHFGTGYGFFQYEWIPVSRFTLIAGGRFDKQSVYGSQFSPKFSAVYEVSPWLSVRGTAGTGFKAPDFRQLYLNFTNAVAGYSVFGSEEVGLNITRLQAENQINQLLLDPSQFGNLQAERSKAYNFGFQLKPLFWLKGNLNAFRNDVRDLIETQAVARKTNGQNVFSYYNLHQVYTQGIETDWTFQPIKNVSVAAGYQLLYAADKQVQEDVKQGEYFRRDPNTLLTTRVTASQYGGLFSRSRHSGNVKVWYENPKTGISGSLRMIYWGRYGWGDTNGNLILDEDSEYVKGYLQWNVSVAKTFRQWLNLQAGVDNVFNFTNPSQIPGVAGRLLYVRAGIELTKHKDETKVQTNH